LNGVIGDHMGKIRLLPPHVYNQIAAGEVVERPSSVVKELVENSLDAEAVRITVIIHDGGCARITVQDNGIGMTAADAQTALKKHATSKITDVHDLHNLLTLGFRGEALPSIASVSQFEMITRHRDEAVAACLRVGKSGETKIDTCGAPTGTTITVNNLFYNTPARRKFLKSKNAEVRHIKQCIQQFCMAYPQVHFTLRIEDKISIDTPRTENHRERLIRIFGNETMQHMIPVQLTGQHMSIRGFISQPNATRPTRADQELFLNGRAIVYKGYSTALQQAYSGLIPSNRYPRTILFLNADPQYIDINVHPAKREVRFEDEREVFRFIRTAVSEALKQNNAIPEHLVPRRMSVVHSGNTSAGTGSIPHSPVPSSGAVADLQFSLPRHTVNPLLQTSKSGTDNQVVHDAAALNTSTAIHPSYRIIGSVFGVYIVLEEPEALVFIDQHAAHERINYERLKSNLLDGEVVRQPLLTPRPVELTPEEYDIAMAGRDVLNTIGMIVEEFGPDTVCIREVPAVWSGNEADMLKDIISVMRDKTEIDTTTMRERLLERMACRSSIMAGENITAEEIAALVKDINTYNIFTCPHGRPIITRMDRRHIDRWFHR